MMNEHAAAFDSLFEAYRGMVLQVCTGFLNGDRETAQDLAQEVFVKVWTALPGFRGDSQVKTWLYRITVNTCLGHVRRQRSRPNVVELTQTHEQLHATETYGSNMQPLYQAIGQLRETDRLIAMMMLDDLEYPEMAQVVGISEGNLRVRIHRIRQQLKKMLNHG